MPPRPDLGSTTSTRFYPDDADHIIKWLAHRVQRPEEKINHALVLGGAQGIGKDTLLEPVKHGGRAVELPRDIAPTHLLGRFNGFAKSVILRVNEARDLGEFDRFGFYDHTKIYTAAPPDVLRVDEKHLREYYVFNVSASSSRPTTRPTASICRPTTAATTSPGRTCTKEDFSPEYWNELWGWYERTAASSTSRPIWPSSISRPSTRRRRRRRRRRSGTSSTPTARRRTPSWRMSSTRLIPTR